MYNQLISPKVYTLETDRSGRVTNRASRYGKSATNPVRPTPPTPIPPVEGDFILQEDGFYLLQEDNSKLILE